MLFRIFFAGLFLFQICKAQTIDWLNYQPLICYGNVPADFFKLSSQKYEDAIKKISDSSKTEVKKAQQQFYLNSNYKLDEVLHSGRVVFGDPVTTYLNQIKNVLLEDDSILNQEIRIYTLRSAEANAFTSSDGIVLVTTGLIAQAENEAQLAFILAHEFSHYIRKHAITEYIENNAMAKGKGIYKNLSSNDLELKSFSYSKELESEADALGLQLYRKSNYAYSAAQEVFDVLLYSYLPFDEVAFKEDFFNKGNYKIPAEYFLENVNAITADDDYDDEKNTHPNIKKRKRAIFESLINEKDDGRKLFIVSESDFNTVRKICRFEECLLYLNDCNFEAAFYSSYLLLQNDPQNIFLKKLMTRSLYAKSMYKTFNHSLDYNVHHNEVEGEQQQVFFLFENMPKKDFNILAMKSAYSCWLLDTSDLTLENICKSLANTLVKEFKLSLSDFDDGNSATKTDTVLKSSNDYKTKLEKIKSTESEKNITNVYWKYAFVDFKRDVKFGELFNITKSDSASGIAASSMNKTTQQKIDSGIEKVVIVNPIYLKVDEVSKNPVKYEAAENLKLDLQDKISMCAAMANLSIEYLERMKLQVSNTEMFNDLAVLNNWVSEEFEHDDVPVINSSNELMQPLLHKYNTNHFVWLGVVNFHEKKRYVIPIVALSVIYFPALPFTIAWAAKPKYETVFFTLVVDAEKGDFEMEYVNTVKANDSESIQKSNLYYIFQLMKSNQEKK